MIDTVILMLPRSKATVVSSTESGIPTWDLQASTRAYKKYVKNPTKRDEESGLYFPRLTGFRRRVAGGFESVIKVEFSAPKLLYKNNVDELTEDQFQYVVNELRDRLTRMGVYVSAKDLAEAEVRSVHYSKNILLQNGYSSRFVIGEIAKVNLNQRLDMTKARYINEGQSLYAYAISHSVVIYDKIADIQRDKKRAIDKDVGSRQLELFKRIKRKGEILRFEVRLSQTRKLNSLFIELGFPEKPNFRDVFSLEKSAAVLTHYWDDMIAANSLPLFAHSFTVSEVFRQILQVDSTAKRKEALYLTGLLMLSQAEGGMRGLRQALSTRIHDRSWYRISSDLEEISSKLKGLQQREWFDQVTDALRVYKPYRVPKGGDGVL